MMIRKLGLFILISLMIVSLAQAAPGGANITEGGSSSASGTSSTSLNIEDGNVTYVDIYSQQITGKWAGFFGNVSGALILGDSSNNLFYSWTVTNFDGAVVYATNDTISDWTGGNIAPVNSTVLPSYLVGDYTDNFTTTFDATEAFVSSSLNKANTPYASTWQNGAQGALKTYGLYSAADNANIWAGLVDDNSESFKGENITVDYQILLPAQAMTTYSFYLEMP